MIKTYLKIALRKLRKNKLYSFVNVAGLMTGISSCLLIGLYIAHELSYDRFQKNADRIVRVTTERNGGDKTQTYAETGTRVGPELKRRFTAIDSYARVIKSSQVVSAGPEKTFDEKQILFADPDFFKMFSFGFLRGQPATALDAPNKMVVTKTIARKYFGTEDVVGKMLHAGSRDCEITGVTDDVAANSQIQYNMVISFSSLGASKTEKWSEANYITYLLLHPGTAVNDLEKQEMAFMKSPAMKSSYDATGNEYLIFHFEPLLQVHLHSALDGLEPNANIMYVYILGIIALMILMIACVNYTNLAIAQSSARTIEIGIRKVLGARKNQLFGQFIGEAALLVFVALIISVAACVALLPVFNSITGKNFTPATFANPMLIGTAIVFACLISLVAGSYPALVLSNKRITGILKSGTHVSAAGGGLRKALIVFQFVISIFLMIATVVILQQLSYIRHKDIGYNKDEVVVLPIDPKIRAQYGSMKAVLESDPRVASVSAAYETPVFVRWGDYASPDAGNSTEKRIPVSAMPVQLDFIKTMGLHIIEGTDFAMSDFALMDTSNDYKNFRRSYILNEKAAHDMGWTPEQAIGKTIYKGAPGVVKAVVKDFNYASVHVPVGDMILFPDTSMTQEMYVKLRSNDIAGGLSAIQTIWQERVKHRPFQYRFLDDDYNSLYITEQHSAKLFGTFSLIAILLACLGLFALAAYATVQRTKEIGIRKVLGATMLNITSLVSKEFLQLVAIAIAIASPLAWYASKTWLDDFAYRIAIEPWVFIVAGIAALVIALFTVGFHAIKASLKNPVNALRTE